MLPKCLKKWRADSRTREGEVRLSCAAWLPQGPTEQGAPMQVHALTVGVKVPLDRTDLALQELPSTFSIINLLLE